MRLWRAILLMNLALALGVMVGYLAWGRDILRLQDELASARRQASVPGTWTVRGVVRAVLLPANVIILTHEDISGFMASMTMGFPVKDPKLLEGLDIGATVRFTLTGIPPDLTITTIQRESP